MLLNGGITGGSTFSSFFLSGLKEEGTRQKEKELEVGGN